MNAYIHSYRTISELDSFENGINGTSASAEPGLKHPDYKALIPAALIRRMSPIIRMGVGLAISVKEEKKIEGIIVGTGLGCLQNTENFMEQFVQKKEGILAPTSFIQSTHNTIAGQIGLILQDNCYNSTYTQRGLSFENALLDAILLSMETNGEVIVGGLDEKIDLMETLAAEGGIDSSALGEGGSFFRISQDPVGARAHILACDNLKIEEGIEETIQRFLKRYELDNPAKRLYGNSFLGNKLRVKAESYSSISGEYMTNSAFGLQLACELLIENGDKSYLVINNSGDKDLGLIYILKS
jgi:3-oxoacyl-[acyl-carrier-protein] synthase II